MSDSSPEAKQTRSGELLFIGLFLLFALFLLSQMPDQVKWFKKTKWAAQPALWSGIGLLGMVGFGAAHFLTIFRRTDLKREGTEAAIWLRSIEFAMWFMLYVWTVPIIGYLLATLIVAPVLSMRMGYRSVRMIGGSAAVGFAIVLVFKTFLSVKIPGGAIYAYLPGGIRNFMILNF